METEVEQGAQSLRTVFLHVSDANADSPLVGIQTLDSGESLDCLCETQETVGSQIGAGDVLQEGA